MKPWWRRERQCDYCTRTAHFRGRGWPPGGWWPRWLARAMATEHRACSDVNHFLAASGAIDRARSR